MNNTIIELLPLRRLPSEHFRTRSQLLHHRVHVQISTYSKGTLV
jgi:hypothetical protein